MLVRIKASNTDPTWIYTLAWETALSARWRVMTYLSIRGDGPGPLFVLQDGHPLSRSPLTEWFWQIKSSAGIHGNLFEPEVCIGAAVVAAHNRIPDHLIQA